MKKQTSAIGWLLCAAGKQIKGIGWLTFCNALISVSAVGSTLVLREIIDAATDGRKDAFVMFAAGFGGIICLQLLLRAFIRFLEEQTRSGIENALKSRAYRAVMGAWYSSLSGWHTGELLNYMTNDVTVIADGMTGILPGAAAMAVKLFCAMCVLLTLDWRFGIILLIGGIVLIIVTYRFRKVMKQLHKSMQEEDGNVRSFLQETVENILIIRSFQAEERVEAAADKRMELHRKVRMKKNHFSNFCNIGFGLVMNGGYFFGLVWCGVGILQGRISYGTLTAVLQLINQIQQPFANVTGYLPKYYSMCASAERLMELEALPKEETAVRMEPEERNEWYREMQSIEADGILFGYGERTVLEDASLTIRKGDFVAFTGRSGIGKSTLLKLLLAVYIPQDGTISFKTEDARIPLTAKERSLFSYVPQGNLLLSGTIADAIDFLHPEGKPFTSQEKKRMEEACRIACADEFIRKLPMGYDTKLGEKGAGLSEGQMQRLTIARAIYEDAPILLLDEATSALDEQTEQRLLQNLKEVTDKTVLIVTHRKAALQYCNRLIAIQKKKFIEFEQFSEGEIDAAVR